MEHQGGRRAAGGVEVHGLLQVQVAHRVAADDQKVLVPQKGHAVFYAARGTKGLRLGKVAQVHALDGPVPKMIGDRPGHVVERDGDLSNAAAAQQGDDVFHHGLVEQGGHGLGQSQTQRAQTRPLSPGQNHGFQTETILSGVFR